jgi:ribosomal protein L12E/L44/L45/RPP1/RPP2
MASNRILTHAAADTLYLTRADLDNYIKFRDEQAAAAAAAAAEAAATAAGNKKAKGDGDPWLLAS